MSMRLELNLYLERTLPLLGMCRQLRPGMRVEEGHGGCAPLSDDDIQHIKNTDKSYKTIQRLHINIGES